MFSTIKLLTADENFIVGALLLSPSKTVVHVGGRAAMNLSRNCGGTRASADSATANVQRLTLFATTTWDGIGRE